jgi:Sigma-70, region 4
VVQQLDACLSSVPSRTRRVLVLRVGLGRADSHSRHGVARMLDLPVRNVGRIERRGVRQLRRLDRSTGCASGVSADRSTMTSPGAPIASPPSSSGHTVLTSGGGSGTSSSHGSGGDSSGGSSSSSSSPGASGGVLGESAEHNPPAIIAPGAGGGLGTATMILALLIAGAASVVAARRELRN